MATSTVRAVILAAAVVLGLVGITKAFPEGGDSPITPPAAETGDVTPSPAVTTPASPLPTISPRAPRNVSVLVLNGAGITGLAAEVTTILQDAGYDTQDPDDGARRPQTVVFFQAGSQAEAEILAEDFFQGARVRPATQAAATDADITVILGEDGPAPGG